MKKRMLSILLTIVILVGLMPTTVLAAGGDYAPTDVYVTQTEATRDDKVCVTIKWKTTDPVIWSTSDENIGKSYIYIEFKNDNVRLIENGGWWYNMSGETGNQTLKCFFNTDVLEEGGTGEAYCELWVNPGATIRKIGLHNELGVGKKYGGDLSFHTGEHDATGSQQIATYKVGNAKGYNESYTVNDNILWSTTGATSMNTVDISKVLSSADVSNNTSSLPSGVTVSIPLTVSALTTLGTDAAHSYTGKANSAYGIGKDVYAKVSLIKYVSGNYNDSVYFSEKEGKLYLNVKESIYDIIGTATAIELPVWIEVKNTLTGKTASGGFYLDLNRPKVEHSSEAINLAINWQTVGGYYKTAHKAELGVIGGGRQLPDSIKVTAGDKELTADTDYTYDKNTGIVDIYASAVTGDIKVIASAEKTVQPLDDITRVLPDFDEDIWYNESNSTLTTAQDWTVSTSKNGEYSDFITLDREGVSLTKTLYFSDNDGRLYSYELTYKRDITPPVISEISGTPAEGTYNTSAEIGFTASDTTSDLREVTVTCDDGERVTFDGDSFIADRNGTYTIIVKDNAQNETVEKVTVENIHSHSYSYAVNAENTAQIIESCSCGHKQTATLAYSTGSGSYTYTGSAITPVQVTYSDGWVGDRQTEITYSNNISVGTGAKGTLTIGGATAIKTFVITKETPTLTVPTAQNDVIYGAKLSEVELTSGWVWADGNIVPTVQNSGYTAYYIPEDTTNYDWTQIFGWNAAEGRVERTVSVTVNKADLTITVEDISATYGDAVPNYTVSYNGFENGDDASKLSGTLAFHCDYVQFSDKDEYIIEASGYSSDNYDISYVDGTLTVSAKPITVTIQNATSVYGNEIAELKAVSDGIVNGDTNVYSLSTTATSTSNIGAYDITGMINNSNYDITFENGTNAYTITERELTVSVEVADKKYDGKKDAEITSAVLNNVANGDNLVLTKGTATFETVNVGKDININFTTFSISGDKAENYTLVQPTGIKASITNGWNPAANTEYVVSEPNDSGWLKDDFVITARPGYKLSLTNTDDGEWKDTLTDAVEGGDSKVNFYVKNTADGTISEMATTGYKLDKVSPTGKVYFDERNDWEEFLHTISFGLFYKDEVIVKAEAADTLSGVAKIEFFESSQEMSLEALQNSRITWEELPEEGKSVTLEDKKQFIYYIRITDNAGNVTYISTNGAEYDTTAPAINGIKDGAVYYTTQKVTVTDKNVDSVILNEQKVTEHISLDGNMDKAYTIIVTDKAGNETSVTVTMKPIASINTPIESIKEENVKSSDKESIDSVITQVNELLKDEDLTSDEKSALEKIKSDAGKLASKIEMADKATITENTDKVKDVTSENVTPKDKNALENAKADLEEALKEYGSNMTEEEKKEIQEEIDRIDDAIAVVEKIEKVQELIEKLPNTITKDDADAIKAAQDAYNALSDYEKALIGKDVKKTLDKAVQDVDNILSDNKKELEDKEAEKESDKAEEATTDLNKRSNQKSPATGDSSNMFLWILLLFVSGGSVITLIAADKKRSAVKR